MRSHCSAYSGWSSGQARSRYVVGIAASGEEAIDHAQRLQPDLVLMDVRLRGPMDGIEDAQHIWAQFQIPVIFMSGYTSR